MQDKFERNGQKKVKIRTSAMIEGIENLVCTWRELLKCHAEII
jgi:hypothetical protein